MTRVPVTTGLGRVPWSSYPSHLITRRRYVAGALFLLAIAAGVGIGLTGHSTAVTILLGAAALVIAVTFALALERSWWRFGAALDDIDAEGPEKAEKAEKTKQARPSRGRKKASSSGRRVRSS